MTLPTARRAEADTPPSAGLDESGRWTLPADVDRMPDPVQVPAGPDAGLETVAWVAWDAKTSSRALTLDRPDEMPGRKFSEPLVIRQSAAAALEAAAKREGAALSKLSEVAHKLCDMETRAFDAEAQVAALREALERLEWAGTAVQERLKKTPSVQTRDFHDVSLPFVNALDVARQALSAIPTPGRAE